MSTIVAGGWPPSPANDPGIRKVIGPDFIVYKDPYDQKYHGVSNGSLGLPGQDFSGASADIVLQSIFNSLATITVPSQPLGGFPADNTQFRIQFVSGNFYFAAPVTINVSTSNGGLGISLWGMGDNKTTLVLNSGVNDDMFKVTGVGNIFEVGWMKVFGNKANQTGTSNGFNITSSGTGEIDFYHCELRDFLTACVVLANTGNTSWNYFDSVWMLNSGYGIRSPSGGGTPSDVHVVGSKFETMTSGAIAIEVGNGSTYMLVGNRFGGAASGTAPVYFSTGTTSKIIFTGNVVSQYVATGVAGLQFSGNGLGSLSDFKTVITSNIFTTTNAAAIAVQLGDYVDGIRISNNRFNGYTDPFNIINTHPKATTYIDGNMGLPAKYSGWGVTSPSVPSTGVDQQNTNPFPVKIFISGVGSGITAYGITDGLGTLNSFTTTVNVGNIFEVPPYGKIRLTYTGLPTWLWFGTGNGGGV